MKHTVHEHTLENGAKGLVVNVPGAAVCNMVAYFNSGYMFGSPDKYELPHVMEHLMSSGNKRYPTAAAFKTEVEKNGAYRNAMTSPYLNGYVYECAAFERERMLELMASQITSPLFPEVSFGTEISNVREELTRLTTEYGRVSWNILSTELFPLGSVNLGARIEQLSTLTRDDVAGYYARTHTAKNLRFFFAGDFPDGGKVFAEKFAELIHEMPEGEYLPFLKQKPIALEKPVLERHDIKQLYYVMRLTAEGSTDSKWDVPLSLLRALLVQGYRSWVLGEARERGLAYGVGASGGTMPSITDFGFNGFVTYDHAHDLFELMVKHTERVRRGDIPEDDLEATKTLMIGSTIRNQQTAGDLLGWYASNYVYEGRIYPIEERYDEIRAVTKHDVAAALERVIVAGGRGMSFVGEVNEKLAGEYERIFERIWH